MLHSFDQSMACLGLTFGLTLPSIGMLDVADGLELAGTLTLRATPGPWATGISSSFFHSLSLPSSPFIHSIYHFLSTPFLPYFIFTITLHSYLFTSFLTSPSIFYFWYSCSFHIIQQHWDFPFDESGRLFVPAQLVSLVQNWHQHQLQNSRKENGWSSLVRSRLD